MRDALPHASFIGFTGTPIELTDANTRSVFGDYVSVYDIQRSVEDGATVPIYYESRLAKLALRSSEVPHIDPDFDEATEGEELERRERLKSKWAQLEAVVGAEDRVDLIARDLIDHYEDRVSAENLQSVVKELMEEQHGEMVRALKDGSLDDVITGNATQSGAGTGKKAAKSGRAPSFGEGIITNRPLDEVILAHLSA